GEIVGPFQKITDEEIAAEVEALRGTPD
ncbi:MAG: hypothetical protein ACI8QS_002456, partial [Planctomycetota bacterium]